MSDLFILIENATDDCEGCGCVLSLFIFIIIIAIWIGILNLTFILAECFDGGCVAYCASCAIIFFVFSFLLSLIMLGKIHYETGSILVMSIVITIVSCILTFLTMLIWKDMLDKYSEYVTMLSKSDGFIPALITTFVSSTIGAFLGYKIRHR